MKTRRQKQRKTRKQPQRKVGIVITRYYMNGCPACEMSKKHWDEFKNTKKSNVKVVEIESANLPPSANVKAFPTYVVRKRGKETNRKEGAIMSAGEVNQLL
jgi:hypothetical protein